MLILQLKVTIKGNGSDDDGADDGSGDCTRHGSYDSPWFSSGLSCSMGTKQLMKEVIQG